VENKVKRGAFISGWKALAPERLVFINESGVNIGMTGRYGHAYKKSRARDRSDKPWKTGSYHFIKRSHGDAVSVRRVF
jgi:hypothetical protein